MRILLVSLLAVLGSAASPALPLQSPLPLPPERPSLPPGTVLELPPRITRVVHVAEPGGTLVHGGGPLSLEVQIENGRATTVPATIVLTPSSGTAREPVVRASVTIAARGTSAHVVTISEGLATLCGSSSWWVALESALPVDGARRQIVVNPGCTFRAEGVDSFRGLPPDRVIGQTERRLHYFNPVLVTTRPNCSNPLRITAELQNATTLKIHDAKLQLLRPGRTLGTLGPMTLAPAQRRLVTLDATFDGHSTTLDVTSREAGQVLRSHFSVRTTPTCLLSVKLR